jgi:hypothetical protein
MDHCTTFVLEQQPLRESLPCISKSGRASALELFDAAGSTPQTQECAVSEKTCTLDKLCDEYQLPPSAGSRVITVCCPPCADINVFMVVSRDRIALEGCALNAVVAPKQQHGWRVEVSRLAGTSRSGC